MASKRGAKTTTREATRRAPPMAPWPQIDKYPFVLGSNVTLAYLSNVYRLATTGYRQQYVDALDELIERDPHAYAVVAQRVLAIAGGRLEVIPAKTKPGTPEEKRAKEIAEGVEWQFDALRGLEQTFSQLAWAVYYGPTAAENMWAPCSRPGIAWRVESLEFIHSRRIAYPDPSTWDPHIWDLGTVQFFGPPSPTSNLSGLGVNIRDYPGKFVYHVPQVRHDYPTRDGVGREIAFWIALKGMGARSAAQYIERFAKPWVTSTYTTQNDGKPRDATKEDIDIAEQACRGLGAGSLAYANLPDSVKLALQGPAFSSSSSGLSYESWLDICDTNIAIGVLGQSDTTKAGKNGSRSAVETRKDGTRELYRYDANCFCADLESGLVEPFVALNYPGEEDLAPTLVIHVDEKPDPAVILKLATDAADGGIPVDADDVAERIGLKTIDQKNPDARRMAPVKPVDLSELVAGITPESAAEKAKQMADAQAALANTQKPVGDAEPNYEYTNPD